MSENIKVSRSGDPPSDEQMAVIKTYLRPERAIKSMSRSRKWWVLGWVWKLGRVRIDIVPSNFNRPLLRWYDDGETTTASFGWGNGNSDDAFAVELTLREAPSRGRSVS